MFSKNKDVKEREMYRYSKELNTSYVDIQIDSYMELFNEWDFSPYANRDLDQEFYEYLEESAHEIPKKQKMCIVLNMPKTLQSAEKEEESRVGFIHYLDYRLRLINTEKRTLRRKGLYYGILGFILLAIGSISDTLIAESPFYDYLTLLAEGFIIGGWVLFWELFTIVFFEIRALTERQNIIKRLKKTEIIFNYNR